MQQEIAVQRQKKDLLEGKNSTYKINRDNFLGRGGFGIVYAGTRYYKRQNKQYQDEVAIKEFKKSQKWRTDEDRDKEILILERFQQLLDKRYVLEVIQIFKDKKTKKYFLITQLAKGESLNDKIKNIAKDEQIYEFCLRMADILNYLHNTALENYYSKDDQKQDDEKKIAIIHRDIKPQNIVFTDKDLSSAYLLDFGVAKIGYTNYTRSYNSCGTANYKAPQISEGRIYNAKVDIYSFGCTLYEILNGGEKLILSSGISLKHGQRENYVKSRLVDLQIKLDKQKKLKYTNYWMQLLENTLKYDLKQRINAETLLKKLKDNEPNDKVKEYFVKDLQNIIKINEKRQIFEINFEILRLNTIQEKIFSIFEHIYFEQPKISKFLLYVLLKFILIFFFEKYNKAKNKAKLLGKTDKTNNLKRIIEEDRLSQLKGKCQEKILKELRAEKENKSQKSGPLEDIVKSYPEILYVTSNEPRRILYQFCYQQRSEIKENAKFAKLIVAIIYYMDEVDNFNELKNTSEQLYNNEVEILSLRKLYKLKKSIDDKIEIQDIEKLFQSCRIDVTVKSNANKEENKTDVQIIQKKSK